jgi:hypothetical protein
MLTFDDLLAQLADRYREQGYTVKTGPGPDDLPDFARAFAVQLCCRRGRGGVLVAAFPDRAALASDPLVSHYAEATQAEADWRFDLAILGPVVPVPDPKVGDAHDLSADQIEATAAAAERAADLGFAREALVSAWGAMEAAARLRLRGAGEPVRWNTPWPELAGDLVTEGAISYDDYDRLGELSQVRTRIGHGLGRADVDAATVHYVGDLARRLRDESQRPAAVTA